jgi:predicted dehydrogenase
MTDKLRVAVLGAGWAGELHAKAFGSHPDVELTAVCSRTEARAQQLADSFGIAEVHTDLDTMLGQVEPDVVTVATPPAVHAEMTLAAIARGSHVLCDKPIATNAADGARMVEAADEAGIKHATGFVWRNDPAVLKLRSLVAEHAVGDVVEVHARCALGAPILPMTWMYEADAGGGALMQHGGHVIDRIRWILGQEFAEVSGELLRDVKEAEVGPRFHNVMDAFGWGGKRLAELAQGAERLPTAPVTADTGYTFRATLASGVRASLWELWHGVGTHPDVLEIVGTRGTLVWSGAGGLHVVRPRQAPEAIPVEGSTEAGGGDMKSLEAQGARMWRRLVDAFVADVRGEPHEPYPTLTDAWRVQQVIDAVGRSDASRAWVAVT